MKYVVYPSWAEGGYAYPWRKLREILDDPSLSGRLKGMGDLSQTPSILYNPPTVLVDGPAGGGIIVMGPAPPEAFNVVLFRDVANVGLPDDMRKVEGAFGTHVSFIEPYDGIGGLLTTGKRARNYPVRATIEHAAAANDEVYWVFGLSDAPGSVKAMGTIPELAKGFELGANAIAGPNEALERETAPWFVGWREKRIWYRVKGCDDRAGYQFAVLLYMGLHLRRYVRALRWVHLVAQVEGKPNARLIATRHLKDYERRSAKYEKPDERLA